MKSDSSLRVAIADDDRSAREVLQKMLQTLGHQVVVVSENGHSLVRRCVAVRPDVVITDNMMPDMTGLEAAAAIYQQRPTSIILLSAFCDRDLVLDAEQKHVLMYLVKPISPEILEAALERCLHQNEGWGTNEKIPGTVVDESPQVASVATLRGRDTPSRLLSRLSP